jgi:hypothetical protein
MKFPEREGEDRMQDVWKFAIFAVVLALVLVLDSLLSGPLDEGGE